MSVRAHVLHGFGYKYFAYEFGEGVIAVVVLRATDDHVVEIRTLVAYPDRVGSGRKMMEVLCDLADKTGVTLWLDAAPYGSRAHIPPAKLKQFYRRLGFFAVKRVDPSWVNGYHRWEGGPFDNPMIRNPQQVSCQPEIEAAAVIGRSTELVHA
jgi:GNAT superfamily N-acetyltransferase